MVSPQESSAARAWAAPEILHGGASTKEGDIFTFAMVVVEVCVIGVLHGHLPTYLPLTGIHGPPSVY